jgi:hypothetical protein
MFCRLESASMCCKNEPSTQTEIEQIIANGPIFIEIPPEILLPQ